MFVTVLGIHFRFAEPKLLVTERLLLGGNHFDFETRSSRIMGEGGAVGGFSERREKGNNPPDVAGPTPVAVAGVGIPDADPHRRSAGSHSEAHAFCVADTPFSLMAAPFGILPNERTSAGSALAGSANQKTSMTFDRRCSRRNRLCKTCAT